MKQFKDTATKVIEKAIKNWLAQAPSRMKKLAKKQNNFNV